MRLLLDSCVWGGTAESPDAAGHEVRWVGDFDADPGDEAILRAAYEQGRILVTLDKDFGELAIVYETLHSGIIRLVGLSARQQGPYCATVLDRFGSELMRGAIVTVTAERVRIRSAD